MTTRLLNQRLPCEAEARRIPERTLRLAVTGSSSMSLGRWPAMRAIFAIIALVCLVGCSAPRASSSRADALKVEISDSPLTVKFINTSTESLRILKPLDGSEWCWIMPHYKLTVTDRRGQTIPLSVRCGLYGYPYYETKWPDDYLVEIPAGGSYSRPLELNHDVPASGTYTLCFHYIFRPDNNRTRGGRYPRHLWRGEVSSNTIDAHLEALERE